MVQTLGQWQFGLLTLGLLVVTGGGFYLWKKSFQHARVMEDTPTSKVRSAAQGFVELSGLQYPLEGSDLTAPLSGIACTWWDYKIEKRTERRTSGGRKTTTWALVEKDTSVGFFHLRDDTGEVLVNPRGADVNPSLTRVWYGNDRRPAGGDASGFGMGRRYRYTERIMRSGEPIYALGHFETWSSVEGPKERAERRARILAEWKENPAELVGRFDADGDGRIDVDEWERARQAAEALVEEHASKAATTADVDILMKPEDDHPFILSTKSQEELTRAYRGRAMAGLLLFLLGGVALGVALTARFGA
ncbi:MAG TPA: GIDE domain-containing protein [Longimicrobiales bacterium]|nr:GIDE domain-containing protein [Longimicrobiales bacterium]